MRVVVVGEIGFCGGVRRAVNLARAAIGHGHVYADGELVHNGAVMGELGRAGVLPYRDGDRIIAGNCIVTRAHGTAEWRRTQLAKIFDRVIDGTCPHMAAMVAIVSGAANDGRSVVIVGDEKHPEVVALVSAAREGRCFVVNSVDDLRRLPPNQHRALVIAQSTIGEEFFATLADKISATWADTEIRNTICSSSRARQRAIIDLSRRVRAIVVVGGSHSNNTTTLVAVARATGLPVFRVETVVDLPIDELREFETVGVATGASTAEETAAEVIATLHGL